MPDEKIWVAMIHHRHGVNVYAGRTQESMLAQVADYCRDEWEGEHIEGDPSDDDAECVHQYFEENSDEWWEGDQTELI